MKKKPRFDTVINQINPICLTCFRFFLRQLTIASIAKYSFCSDLLFSTLCINIFHFALSLSDFCIVSLLYSFISENASLLVCFVYRPRFRLERLTRATEFPEKGGTSCSLRNEKAVEFLCEHDSSRVTVMETRYLPTMHLLC